MGRPVHCLCRALGLFWGLFLATQAALATELALSSDDDVPMRFAVVRSNAPGCEPTCPEWISADGTINAKTPGLLKKMLKDLGKRRLPIMLSSPGGDVEAAMELGRMIRRNRLDVAVGLTRFGGCLPGDKDCKENDGKGAAYFGTAFASGAYCNSACPLMFAGGVRRLSGTWASVGVHQVTTTYQKTTILYRTKYRIENGKKKIIEKKVVSRKSAGSYKTYEMNKQIEHTIAAYMKEMGVGEGFLQTMKNTPASTIHILVPYNMQQMNLTTSFDGAELLTDPNVCRSVPAAANCRVVTVSDLKQ